MLRDRKSYAMAIMGAVQSLLAGKCCPINLSFYFIVLFSSSYLLPFGFHGCSASPIHSRVSRKFDVLSFYWSSQGPKHSFFLLGLLAFDISQVLR